MNIDLNCVECIINQSKRVGETLHLPQDQAQKLVETATTMSKDFSFSKTPPEVATPVYEAMAKILQTDDIYKEIKEKSTQKAKSFLPLLEKKLQNVDDRFMFALKVAVAGNVIDLASEVMFDLQEELEKVFENDFAIDDSQKLFSLLQKAKKVVVLGDNAGEHIFDSFAIDIFKELFPQVVFYYFTRGKPIINDVTYEEALEAGFSCKIVDSGVPTPGFVYDLANKEAQELFDSADVVISKGMGNYECLSPSHKSPIAFLLKIKCNVVASSLAKELGGIVCEIL